MGSGPGAGRNINLPLNVTGNDDADYLSAVTSVVLPAAAEFDPELVIVSAGYDPAIGCPEGEQEVRYGNAVISFIGYILLGIVPVVDYQLRENCGLIN